MVIRHKDKNKLLGVNYLGFYIESAPGLSGLAHGLLGKYVQLGRAI